MQFLNDFFSETYDESRAKFRSNYREIKKYRPDAALEAYPLKNVASESTDNPLTIDVITTVPEGETKKNGILLTSGLHGVEGYTGTAVINLFIKEFAPRLDPRETGFVLVHGINPWGMKHFRRSNENNVDLNRNFIFDWDSLDRKCNANYAKLNSFFNPEGRINSRVDNDFFTDLSYYMSEVGPQGIKEALTLGQYEFPEGIYYGGSRYEESSLFMINIFKKCADLFSRVTFMDVHTGYGQSGDLSLITSPYERLSPTQVRTMLDYPRVLEASESDFYRIEGDIVDYAYRMFKSLGREGDLFGICLEYGTWGEDMEATVNLLKVFFNENRLFRFGAESDDTAARIKADFIELLYPGAPEWREGVLTTGRHAIEAVLHNR